MADRRSAILLTPDIPADRVILTRLRAADAPALFAYRSLPEVRLYQSWEPARLEDAADFIGSLESVEFNTPGTWYQLGIRSRESGALIGDLGVHFMDDGRQVEVGFTLAPDAQGRGFGTEAVSALLEYLFGTLATHRVFASVDPRNERSIRLLQRLGMRREAHLLQAVLFKGEWTDDVIFAILASEWSVNPIS